MFNSLILNILSVFKSNGVQAAQKAMGGLGGQLGKLATQAGAAAGAFGAFSAITGASEFFQNAADQAQQLERNMAAVNQIFQDQSNKMRGYIKGVEQYGLAEAEAAKATVFLGSVLKQSGFELKETANLTQILTNRAVDLATTYGYDVQEALMGMTALFRGEYDPIEKFGVAMKQSEINSELAARGMDKLEGASRRYAEQQIRVQLLLERSSDAAGAFERLQGSLYVSTKKLEAAFNNFLAQAGEPLQDGLAEINLALVRVIESSGPEIIEVFESLGTTISNMAPTVEDAATAFFNMLGIFQQIIDLINMFGGPLSGISGNLDMIADGTEKWAVIFDFLTLTFVDYGRQIDKEIARLPVLADAVDFVRGAYEKWMANGDNIVPGLTKEIDALKVRNNIIDKAGIASAEFAEVNRAKVALALAASQRALEMNAKAANTYMQSYVQLVAMGAATNPWTVNAPWKYTAPTPTGSSAAKAADPIKEFFNNLKEEIAKQKALLKLESMGASESVIETILGASDWEAVYKKIRDGGRKALDEITAMLKRGYDFAMQQREKLKALKENVKDAVTGIADNLLGAFNLRDFGRSTGEIVSNMRKMVERIRAFKDEVTRLAKAGLNPQLLQQVLAMGPTEGLSFARALLAGGNIGELNSLYGQATSLALEAGRGVVTAQQNYYITVNGGVGDKKTIGAAIVEAIKAYERTSGVGWRA